MWKYFSNISLRWFFYSHFSSTVKVLLEPHDKSNTQRFSATLWNSTERGLLSSIHNEPNIHISCIAFAECHLGLQFSEQSIRSSNKEITVSEIFEQYKYVDGYLKRKITVLHIIVIDCFSALHQICCLLLQTELHRPRI